MRFKIREAYSNRHGVFSGKKKLNESTKQSFSDAMKKLPEDQREYTLSIIEKIKSYGYELDECWYDDYYDQNKFIFEKTDPLYGADNYTTPDKHARQDWSIYLTPDLKDSMSSEVRGYYDLFDYNIRGDGREREIDGDLTDIDKILKRLEGYNVRNKKPSSTPAYGSAFEAVEDMISYLNKHTDYNWDANEAYDNCAIAEADDDSDWMDYIEVFVQLTKSGRPTYKIGEDGAYKYRTLSAVVKNLPDMTPPQEDDDDSFF